MGRPLAVADIGSNTTHLLVAEVQPRGLRRLMNTSDWLSLGEVVSREGSIPKRLQERMIETLLNFRNTSSAAKADGLYVFATEAMRRAANHTEVMRQIEARTGLTVDLISPRQEAEFSLRGATLDVPPIWPMAMIEVGGGSAQLALVESGKMSSEDSLAIGTGALIAYSGLTQPATQSQMRRLQTLIDSALSNVRELPAVRQAVACGGVARGIWRSMHPDGDRTLALEEMRFLAWDVSRLTVDQIVARYGVKPKRAATLLPGCMVYSTLVEAYGCHEVRVSEYGVREGALLDLAEGKLQPCRLS